MTADREPCAMCEGTGEIPDRVRVVRWCHWCGGTGLADTDMFEEGE